MTQVSWTYNSLSTALQAWLDDTDADWQQSYSPPSGNVGTSILALNYIIQLAELRVVTDMDLTVFDQSPTATLTPVSAVVTRPAGLIVADEIGYLTPAVSGITPTGAVPFAQIASLLHFEDGINSTAFTDSAVSGNGYTTPVWSAGTSAVEFNSRAKFGLGSGSFSANNTTTFIQTPLTAGSAGDFTQGNDFTVEAWVWIAAYPAASAAIWDCRGASNNMQFCTYISTAGALITEFLGGWFTGSITSVPTVTRGAWNHVALSRVGTTVALYLNGTNVGSITATATVPAIPASSFLQVGGSGTRNGLNGFVDEFRIIQNAGIYSGAAITVPQAPFSNPAGGKWTPLERRDTSWVLDYQDPVVTGPPQFYAEQDITNWVLAPFADQTYTLKAMGIFAAASLIDGGATATTWISSNLGDLLHAAAIIEAAVFLKNEGKRKVQEEIYGRKLAADKVRFRALRRDTTSQPRTTGATAPEGALPAANQTAVQS